jgi:hypothetical protein
LLFGGKIWLSNPEKIKIQCNKVVKDFCGKKAPLIFGVEIFPYLDNGDYCQNVVEFFLILHFWLIPLVDDITQCGLLHHKIGGKKKP